MENTNKFETIRAAIENSKTRSAWDRGVNEYALELLHDIEESYGPAALESFEAFKAAALNGAKDWSQYSWGGCSLAYDSAIAKRLCTPSELKRNHHGDRRPNSREEWLDTQARALSQAFGRLNSARRNA